MNLITKESTSYIENKVYFLFSFVSVVIKLSPLFLNAFD